VPPLRQEFRDYGRRFVGSGDHPPFPNGLTAKHGLIPTFPPPLHPMLGSGRPARSRTFPLKAGRRALDSGDRPLFCSHPTVDTGLVPVSPAATCQDRGEDSGDRPPISVDGDPGFACASVQTTRIGTPLIQLWNTEPIPGRSPPYFGGWRPRICLHECPDDSHRNSAHSAVEHGTYPRAIAPLFRWMETQDLPARVSRRLASELRSFSCGTRNLSPGDCPPVFGRLPPEIFGRLPASIRAITPRLIL
jgi:hypothetical protein